MQAGHLVIDMAGHMRGLDQHFCAIMQAERSDLIGRPVLDITAPADRAECGAAIQALCETGRSFKVDKRFIREDRTLVWVTNTVSLTQGSDGSDMIVATCDPLIPDDARQPALLLDGARFLEACKADRREVFDTALFPDTAWDVLLAAYVAEAEGSAIGLVQLSERLGITLGSAARWVNVLIGQGALEVETRLSTPDSAKAFRLTGATHRIVESHLANVNSMMPGSSWTRRNNFAA